MSPELCDCPVNNDHGEDREGCNAEHDGRGWRCSRESGHDGPHAACTFDEHPVATWGEDDD